MVLLALCLSIFAGCGKKDADSAATDTQPTPEQVAQIEAEYILPTNQTVAAAPPQNAAAPKVRQVQRVEPIQQRLQGAIHAPLTIQLRKYVEKYGRMPDSFSEFVNSSMDSVPPAPDGMKFAIDRTDQTVKAVKK
jgi:hypothetical protein